MNPGASWTLGVAKTPAVRTLGEARVGWAAKPCSKHVEKDPLTILATPLTMPTKAILRAVANPCSMTLPKEASQAIGIVPIVVTTSLPETQSVEIVVRLSLKMQ